MSILSIFEQKGHEAYHGEAVSQLQHAVQAAEVARERHPDDPDFILAAFLHDIGHLLPVQSGADEMAGYGVRNHEGLGADFLRQQGFSEKVCALVQNHVAAKRYLVSSDPQYLNNLSEASLKTLEMQGGPMDAAEMAAFEADPLFDLHIQLRRIDEVAKATDQPVLDWSWIKALVENSADTVTAV